MRTSFARCQAIAATAGLAAAALLTAACGPTSGSPSATSPTATPSAAASPSLSPADPAVCADATALRATLAKIPHALSGNSSSLLTADLDAAKTELDNLADASGDQYRTQDGGLKSALTALQTAISADAHGTGSILGVFTAAGHVTSQAHFLLSAAASSCPSSASPTPGGGS